MLAAALLLIAGAAGALAVGVVIDILALAYAAIALCLPAAVLLAFGVARRRPPRRADGPPAPTWSGASEDAPSPAQPDEQP